MAGGDKGRLGWRCGVSGSWVWGLSPHPASPSTCRAGAACSCLPGRASQEFGSAERGGRLPPLPSDPPG